MAWFGTICGTLNSSNAAFKAPGKNNASKSWKSFWARWSSVLPPFFASAPLSILYFGIFPPPAIVLNLLLVPVATLVIVSGMLSLGFGLAGLAILNAFFNHGPLTLIILTEKMLENVVEIPGLFFEMGWIHESMGFLTLLIYLGSILGGHALRLSKSSLLAVPVAALAIMLCVNAISLQIMSALL